ncbi:MAG: GntR family transcriptional regulator [Candidatus Competibacterales bacterium]|nr:GntR family transcriptional regulator [Candidatus Competibacterales bacterium]
MIDQQLPARHGDPGDALSHQQDAIARYRDFFWCRLADPALTGLRELRKVRDAVSRRRQNPPMKKASRANLGNAVYHRIKEDLFEFRLLPGERFTETSIATRMGVSRTPVREALYRLEREGHIEVSSRAGWNVKPLDFTLYDHLYDVRVILELAAVDRLCKRPPPADLIALGPVWLAAPEQQAQDMATVAQLDEHFHLTLVTGAGNPEMTRIYKEVTERIRIVRRLDFSQPQRIRQTYAEHADILRSILAGKVEQAKLLLRAHIEVSKAEVKKITLHRLYQARSEASPKTGQTA